MPIQFNLITAEGGTANYSVISQKIYNADLTGNTLGTTSVQLVAYLSQSAQQAGDTPFQGQLLTFPGELTVAQAELAIIGTEPWNGNLNGVVQQGVIAAAQVASINTPIQVNTISPSLSTAASL